MRSHEEIYDLVAAAHKAAETAGRLAQDAVQRADLSHMTGQRIEKKLDEALNALGGEREDERGEKVGTGIIGRLMRVEASVTRRFAQYDGWVKLVVGFTAAVAVFGPILWWLLQERLAGVLK